MKLILTARNENNQLIYLTDHYSRQDLLIMRKLHQFSCPACESPLILKIGDIKIPHFAHASHADCESASEGESSLHLEGKVLLHQFFTSRNYSVELEKYLPEIRQRADLLVDGHTAIEFQCSAITARDVLRRSAAYAGVGIKPTWIFGIKEKPADRVQIIHLQEYQKEMLLRHNLSSHLLLLDPKNRQFNYYSNLFHISGYRWVGKIQSLPVEKQTFPFAVPKILCKADYETVCILFAQARTEFIRSQLFAKNRYQNPFWLLCYHLGYDMHNLPAPIGVPINRSECIAEHPVVWQLKVIHALQQHKSLKELISTKEIRINPKANCTELLSVLEAYAGFIQEIGLQKISQERQSELLYVIYCKSVRKLRK